jgi:glutaredoxin 3
LIVERRAQWKIAPTRLIYKTRIIDIQPGMTMSDPSAAGNDSAVPNNSAVKVEIYTTMYCPYCWRAKELLSAKNVDFIEVDVGADPVKRREMQVRSDGGQTVPQIFINGAPIGGCDELYALEQKGQLGPMLNGGA